MSVKGIVLLTLILGIVASFGCSGPAEENVEDTKPLTADSKFQTTDPAGTDASGEKTQPESPN
jgi:hypothetical protein